MRPDERDRAYLWDIRSACRDIVDFIADTSFSRFKDDKRTRYAVERQLLVIGEAANHLSDTLKEQFSHIPWSSIVGLRNIIAHDYGEILTERIWIAATKNVPDLLREIEAIETSSFVDPPT